MAANYILQDRTLSNRWLITISDGVMQYVTTAYNADDEPIFEDTSNSGSYYRLFMDDSMMMVEVSSTAQDDTIDLKDDALDILWRLSVDDGYLSYAEQSVLTRLKTASSVVRVKSASDVTRLYTVSIFDRLSSATELSRLSSATALSRLKDSGYA